MAEARGALTAAAPSNGSVVHSLPFASRSTALWSLWSESDVSRVPADDLGKGVVTLGSWSPGGCYGQALTVNPGGGRSGRPGSHGGTRRSVTRARGRWPRCSRRRINNAAGPLTSAGTPAAYSPPNTDHIAQTAAFPKMIQYVVAEIPSSRSLPNVRTACGMVSRQERKAPVQARISTITGLGVYQTLWVSDQNLGLASRLRAAPTATGAA